MLRLEECTNWIDPPPPLWQKALCRVNSTVDPAKLPEPRKMGFFAHCVLGPFCSMTKGMKGTPTTRHVPRERKTDQHPDQQKWGGEGEDM